ncbi:reverse transcriptase domain-containing protein [Tanacetum coccineum]
MMRSCYAFFPLHSLEPPKDGWTDFLQEPLIPRISLKRPLSEGTARPSKIAKQVEEIRNFKQKDDKTLYQAWELYNDMLYKFLTHDINSHQKVNIFYNGLGTMNRQLLDSQALIPGMTPAQALTAIQTMNIEEVKYGEFDRPFLNNSRNDEAHDKIIQGLETKVRTLTNEVEGRTNGGKFEECKEICSKDGSPLYTPFDYSLEEIEYFSTNSGFFDHERQETDESRMAKALAALEATLEIKKVPQEEKQNVTYYVAPYEPPVPFPRRLEHHAEEALVHKTMESLKKIKINSPLLKEIRQTDNYAKHMKDLVANKPRTEEDEEIRMNLRLNVNNALADLGASISVLIKAVQRMLRKYGTFNLLTQILVNRMVAAIVKKLDSLGLETKVRTLTNEVEGRTNGGKFEECKAICSSDGSPLYTPFDYSLEEIEYFSTNSGFFDHEIQETDKSRMAKALAVLEATLQIKKVPQEENQIVTYYVAPYELNVNNALADLGASIIVMPLSMYKRLGIGKLKPINMVIEMADNTKCTPKGIVENLLIKIDKFIFPIDFVILDMVEDLRMPIILGRPLEEKDDTEVSLEDLEEYEEAKAHTIIEAIHDKLNDGWFKDTSEDEADLEGIINYLKPRSYDGFIDLDNKAYNKRRCSQSKELEFEVSSALFHVVNSYVE